MFDDIYNKYLLANAPLSAFSSLEVSSSSLM